MDLFLHICLNYYPFFPLYFPLKYFDFRSAFDSELKKADEEKELEIIDSNGSEKDEQCDEDDYSDDLPTEEEVRDCMRQFHMRKAQGVRKVKSAPLKRRNK